MTTTPGVIEGVWQAKTLVTEYLNADLPSRLINYRTHWGKDESTLPTPAWVIQYEPLALDHWPTIINLAMNTASVVREDYGEGADPVYRVTYDMRTYIWVKAVGEAEVTEIRDNLTTVVRSALLDHPALREVPRWEHCNPLVMEDTIREEYSDLTVLKGDRYLAGAYVAYQLAVSETITREPLTDTLAYLFSVDVEQMEKTANAPTLVLATAGNTEATLIWKAPTWYGGLDPIDWYQIEQSQDGGDNWSVTVANTGSKQPRYNVTGLTNGETYQFRVAAVNSIGVGATSTSSNAVVPTA